MSAGCVVGGFHAGKGWALGSGSNRGWVDLVGCTRGVIRCGVYMQRQATGLDSLTW